VGDPKAIEAIVDERPDLVVHLAAMTDVDGCEENPQEAFRVNADGSAHVAQACHKIGSPLVAVGTDYVFDGESARPYREDDPPHPINVYGASKHLGEQAIRSQASRWMVIRSAWLYGVGGKNFVDRVVEMAQRGGPLRVVNDQFGSPTYTEDLADGMMELLKRWLRSGWSLELGGIYHVVNRFACSRWELAIRILKEIGVSAEVEPIGSDRVDRPARRPGRCVLATDRFEQVVGRPLRPWWEALSAYLHTTRRTESCAC
jgi:dTDP-4-dehydrorhamnose reductase